MNQIQQKFVSSQISFASSIKKDQVKLELLTDIDMLLMVENQIWKLVGIRSGLHHSFNRYAKANKNI